MKVILYMAISLDGFIAKRNYSTDFVSEKEWSSFVDAIKKAGNLITGRTTYERMISRNEIKRLGSVKIVVVTTKEVETVDPNHKSANSPQKSLEILRKGGFKEALISAGPQLNTSFLNRGEIDEIYIDIEPIFLGKGIKLFSGIYLGRKLKLIGLKRFSVNEVQLRYRFLAQQLLEAGEK